MRERGFEGAAIPKNEAESSSVERERRHHEIAKKLAHYLRSESGRLQNASAISLVAKAIGASDELLDGSANNSRVFKNYFRWHSELNTKFILGFTALCRLLGVPDDIADRYSDEVHWPEPESESDADEER